MSQSTPKAGKTSGRSELRDTIVVIIEALIIAVLFRTFVYQPFSIPTASMQSTLMIGDYFVASKFTWGYGKYSFPVPLPFNGRILGRDPNQGDVAVFRNEIANEDYIKRVVGMPGDTVQMIDGILHINGTAVEREEIGQATDRDSFGMSVPVTVYRETLPNGSSHIIQEVSDQGPLDNTGEYVVPAGHYFMMGDNRDRSQDSRVLSAVGYVPAQNLIGKADARFFSITDNIAPWKLWEWPANVRFDRMFTGIE
ncbi:signal peptidase I [Arsenicitalea aurantiaca]|uniref:Signal peptidase I n=1 Tax=Arsenicitalea aurantiaca TaxID=1783274 RepID=A0A433XEI4_9HYPH|nr:signal peptidase I [Arsenicitalea aurantiaca]RUT32527.1 signal peptidase I [Arsenicitalea aurantiaca]